MFLKKGIVIGGPTGVGKTELSIEVAKFFNGEVISCDSTQIYKGLDIGTAKVTSDEMKEIPHHLIDIITPLEKFDVGSFQKLGDNILNKLEEDKKTPILVGGTGLYISSLTQGLANLPKGDKKLRTELEMLPKEVLYKRLLALDPEAASTIHPNNLPRVTRALEVCLLTGERFSKVSKENIKGNNFDFTYIFLTRERENLYSRIDQRVELMFTAGLLDEVKSLYREYGEPLKKLKIIGYNEIIAYLNNEITLEKSKELIKKHSRNYAKRQFTWFNNSSKYLKINLDFTYHDEALEVIKKAYYE